jgi:hypothetical protein
MPLLEKPAPSERLGDAAARQVPMSTIGGSNLPPVISGPKVGKSTAGNS